MTPSARFECAIEDSMLDLWCVELMRTYARFQVTWLDLGMIAGSIRVLLKESARLRLNSDSWRATAILIKKIASELVFADLPRSPWCESKY